MKTLILQNLTHRGTIAAEGFLLSGKILSEAEMRRRVLSVWQPNAKVYRYGDDLIVLFADSFSVDCRRAVGLPLVRYGEILSSFPLRKIDLDNLIFPSDTIVLLTEGRIETVAIRNLTVEIVENWFDVSDFQIVAVKTLGEIHAQPQIVEKIETINLREELKDVPPADEKLKDILQTLRQKKDEFEKAKSGQSFQTGNYSGTFSSGFGGIFDALKNLFRVEGGQNSNASADQPKLPGKVRKAFTKMLFQMKIAQLVGRKQASYLAEMMEMFERGDLETALKHAIPLEDMQALKEESEKLPFLGFLRPRADLQINYNRQSSSSSTVFLEDNWFAHLRELYRQTFDRLVAQKRFEEAAFVLAELLKSNHEAVEFLEKHGKYRLAAELAESRDLPKDIIARQWFLAGEKRKAIQIAVLYDCFEYIVTKLEQQKHAQATELREIWAENLAISGNYKAAINTIWTLEDRRILAAEWIERVIAFGGAAAAEMLAKKIVLFPESFAETKLKLLEIVNNSGDEAVEQRVAFARETLLLSPNAELRLLARPLARKLLADMSEGFRRFTSPDFRRLIEVTGDYTLRTDLPKLFEIAEKKDAETLLVEIAENDRGANHVHDAHLLPDGKIAVALGEAGVKILSKQGKTIAHFDQPTHKFVVSDFGNRAICLARRGDSYRLARIDFVTRRAAYWCDAKIENYAATFDGNLWFIAEKDAIYAIDVTAENFEAVWRVPEIGGQIYEISRSKTKLMLLIFNEKGIEKWWYDLPQLNLRSRNQMKWLTLENENQAVHSISSFIAFAIVQVTETVEEQQNFEARVYDYEARMNTIRFATETSAIEKPQIVDRNFVLTNVIKNAVSINLYTVPNVKIAEFTLRGIENLSVKLDEKFLTIADTLGRVVIFDHKEKILRKNIRV